MTRRGAFIASLALGLLGLGWPVAPVEAAAQAEAAATATATPSTGLVHRQRIRLTTAGWQPGTYLMVFQCPQGGVTSARCEELRGGHHDGLPTNAQGRLAVNAQVQVVLDGAHGMVDCRVRACILVVARYLDAPTRRAVAPLAFDPEGPDPDRPALTVTPDADLVDDQEVVVESADVRAGPVNTVGVVQCRLPARSMDDCDKVRETPVGGSGGDLDGPVRLSAIIHPVDGPFDCRTGPCALVVLDHPRAFRTPLSEMPLAPLAFDPQGALAPPPVVGVDPADDLVDDQEVQVTGAGFAPGEDLDLYQCNGPLPANGRLPARCRRARDFPLAADGGGAFDVVVRVRTLLTSTFATTDCRVAVCRLLVRHGGPSRQVAVDLHFDPDVPPLNGRITVTPSTGLHEGDRVTVRGSGWRAGDVLLVNLCAPRTTNVWSCATANQVEVDLGPPDGGGPGVRFVEEVGMGRRTVAPDAVSPWDCRVRRCVLLAHSSSDTSDVGRAEVRFA